MNLLKSTLRYINHNLEYIIFFIFVLILAVILINRTLENFFNENKGINQLDAIIYINLENRNDRKDLLIKELESLDVDKSKIHKVSGIYIPKNGHKGCIQSHILALNMIKLNSPRWKRVLILEDDAELTVEPDIFNKTLSTALEKLDVVDPEWNVLMLATLNKVLPNKQQNIELDIEPSRKLQKIKSATTSSAYIVRDFYVDKILELFDTCNNKMQPEKLNEKNHEPWALDQQWAILQERDKWYSLEPDIIKQREIWSTILNESHK